MPQSEGVKKKQRKVRNQSGQMSMSMSISIKCTVLLPEFQAQQHMVRSTKKSPFRTSMRQKRQRHAYSHLALV